MIANFPEIMTIGEAAQYLRISSSSLYKLAQSGRVPCQKVGCHWRFCREAIDRWLEQSRPIAGNEEFEENGNAFQNMEGRYQHDSRSDR
jgi:excisionase family DNA binding protein